MFLDTIEFTFTQSLERDWKSILAEFKAIPGDRLVLWPEHAIYDFGWRAYPLVALGETVGPNADSCPETMRILQTVPGLVNAGFSLFAAGTHVHPHVGYTSSVLRFHLGLKIPDGCGICVGGETRRWEEGKLLAFDDMVEHSAWNNSDQDRAILLFDVLRPGAKLEVTPSSAQAINDYLSALRNAS